MIRKSAGALCVFLVFICKFVPEALAQSEPAAKTVLDAVYTESQAVRGQASYTAACGGCHGADLQGVSAPELTGGRFIERWREAPLDALYNFIRERMPPAREGSRRTIPDGEYLDILAHVLKVNGYRSGSNPLTAVTTENILMVGMNGPQPVPDGSLVATIGCLSEMRSGVWTLTDATEPARNRTGAASTPEELKKAAEKSLGSLTFRLTDMEAVSDFAPDAHRGHKVLAKGFLIRQPNAERISLSSLEPIDSNCKPKED